MCDINFITSNQGKVKSLENTFNQYGLNVKVIARNLDIIEPQLDTVQEVSKYKALKAFEIVKAPVLVEDGGLAIKGLNDFPSVYTKYVLKTIGIDGILNLMKDIQDRRAKFVSFAIFVDASGGVMQFEREGGEFEISEHKIDIQSPLAWSELWKIIYLKEYDKNLCEMLDSEVAQFYGAQGSNGSIQKFVKWYLSEHKKL